MSTLLHSNGDTLGQILSGSNYFYTKDHPGSVRDMTDSTGAVQARYEYGMWGEVTQTVGTLSSDFQYAGYYAHPASGLNLTVARAYSPTLGRWINRDPIGEAGGINLYAYVGNDPTNFTDELGLEPTKPQKKRCPKDTCKALAAWINDLRKTQAGQDYENSATYLSPAYRAQAYGRAMNDISGDRGNWSKLCQSDPEAETNRLLGKYGGPSYFPGTDVSVPNIPKSTDPLCLDLDFDTFCLRHI